MIRNSTKQAPDGVLSAYSDYSAVMAGSLATRFFPGTEDQVYRASGEAVWVNADQATEKSAALPEELVEKITAFEGETLER